MKSIDTFSSLCKSLRKTKHHCVVFLKNERQRMMIIHELHVTMRKQKEIPFWRIVVNNWFKVYKNDNFMEDKTETCSRTQESIKIRELKAMYDPD